MSSNDPGGLLEPLNVSPAANEVSTDQRLVPRDILRLRRCPRCDYDLRTLPAEHRCPECGFPYDRSMFAVYGWTGEDRYSVTGRMLWGTWTERVLAGLILLFLITVVPIAAYEGWKTGANFIEMGLIVLALMIGGGVRLRSHVKRVREECSGTLQLLFTRTGASRRRGPGEPQLIPWERFRRLRFRKLRTVRGGKRLWLLRLTVPFFRYFGWERFEALIECTPREAALVRNEIRRRLRNAGAAKRKSGGSAPARGPGGVD